MVPGHGFNADMKRYTNYALDMAWLVTQRGNAMRAWMKLRGAWFARGNIFRGSIMCSMVLIQWSLIFTMNRGHSTSEGDIGRLRFVMATCNLTIMVTPAILTQTLTTNHKMLVPSHTMRIPRFSRTQTPPHYLMLRLIQQPLILPLYNTIKLTMQTCTRPFSLSI